MLALLTEIAELTTAATLLLLAMPFLKKPAYRFLNLSEVR